MKKWLPYDRKNSYDSYYDWSENEIVGEVYLFPEKLQLTGFPFHTLQDVFQIYKSLNGHNDKGSKEFLCEAKKIAVKQQFGPLQFKDQQVLFDLFQRYFYEKFKKEKISCWEELISFIS